MCSVYEHEQSNIQNISYSYKENFAHAPCLLEPLSLSSVSLFSLVSPCFSQLCHVDRHFWRRILFRTADDLNSLSTVAFAELRGSSMKDSFLDGISAGLP